MTRDQTFDGTRPAAPAARIDESTVGGAAVVAVDGELDVGNIDVLRRPLVVAAQASDTVVMDLSAVTYLDSSSISLLVAESAGLRARRAELRIVAPAGGRARRVFALSGVERGLALFETVDAALAARREGLDLW